MPASDSASSAGRSTGGPALSSRRRLWNFLRLHRLNVDDEESIAMTNTSTNSSLPVTSSTQPRPSYPVSTAATSVDANTSASHPTTLLFGGLILDMTRSDDFDSNTRKAWTPLRKRLLAEDELPKMSNASLEWTRAETDSMSVKTILISCEEEDQKRQIEETCAKLEWLQRFITECQLQVRCVVMMPPEICALSRQQPEACGSRLQDGCTLLLPNHHIESLCGLGVLIKAKSCGTSRYCTLGGIVTFQDRFYGWTTRHSFEQGAMQGETPSGIYTSSSSEQKVHLDVLYASIALRTRSRREPDYDYALIDLTGLPSHILARLPTLNKVNGQVLHGCGPRDKHASGDVAIATAGNGTLHGQLRSMTELIFIGAAVYSVQRIVVDRIISKSHKHKPSRDSDMSMVDPGCSGSWVTKNQDVCGFVVAARSDLPWLYMVSMAEALQDMEKRLGASACIATKANSVGALLDQLPVIHIQPALDTNKFEHDYTQQGAFGLSYLDERKSEGRLIKSQKLARRDSASLFSDHRTPSRYSMVMHRASKVYSTVEEGVRRWPSRLLKIKNKCNMVHTSSESQCYASRSLSDVMIGGELCIGMIPCFFELAHEKATKTYAEQVRFGWLLSQGTGQEIQSMASTYAAQWLLSEVVDREVYFSSCSCVLVELKSNRVLNARAVEEAAEWSQAAQSMVLKHCSEGGSCDFSLTLKFECAIVDRTFNKQSDQLSQMRGVLKQHMVSNYRNQQYLPRRALTTILSEEFMLQFLESSRKCDESVSHGHVGHLRLQSNFPFKVLLASAILAELSLNEISHLCQSQRSACRMPLRSQDLAGVLSADQSTRFLEAQWQFMPLVFDETHSTARISRTFSSSLSTNRYALIHDSMILPLVNDAKKPLLGQGHFGAVFKVMINAEQHSLSSDKHKKFAVKQFYGQRKVSFDRSESAARMLKALSETKHQHILTHISSWCQDGQFHMLLDLADENLESHMRTAPPPTLTKDTTLSMLRQVKGLADAIRHMHNLGPSGLGAPVLSDGSSAKFVYSRTGYHLDLKPTNILVFQREQAFPTLKISDFGSASIAHSLQRETPQMLPIEEAAYGAPEKISQAHVGAAYDIWSLGCVFMEILIFVMGRKTTSEFAMERRKLPEDHDSGSQDEQFWYLSTDGKPQHKPAVVETLKILKDWSASRGVLAELLKLVRRMLSIDEIARPNAANAANDLDAMLHQANIDLADNEDFYLQDSHTYRWELAVPPSETSDSSDPQVSDFSRSSGALSITSASSDADDISALSRPEQLSLSRFDHGAVSWQDKVTEKDIYPLDLTSSAKQLAVEGDNSVYYSALDETEAVETLDAVERTISTQQHPQIQISDDPSARAALQPVDLLQGLAFDQSRLSSLLEGDSTFVRRPLPIGRTVDDLDICITIGCNRLYHARTDFVRAPPSRGATWPISP